MRPFLVIFLRCILGLGLGFTPVANALEMASMATPRQGPPSCHAAEADQHRTDGKAQGKAHCHCAMSIALPVTTGPDGKTVVASDHPLTEPRLLLGGAFLPDTPPPRA
ncbi:MAG TPA: hypothetical protein PKH69_10495 [Thiobacillaceae bacterium]|nr:hypothetical protein [Thiobacillaceae bacterium]HNU64905.1 hypothetical protein [Thiobacillaceae bacterium]